MGIFSMFKSAASKNSDNSSDSSSEINTLDVGSDRLIASICKFDPSNVKDEVKEKISQHIKQFYSEDNSEPYNKEEVALIKMLLYHGMSTELQDIKNELEIGIRHIIEMDGDCIANRTLVKVYNSIDL